MQLVVRPRGAFPPSSARDGGPALALLGTPAGKGHAVCLVPSPTQPADPRDIYGESRRHEALPKDDHRTSTDTLAVPVT